MTQDNKTQSAPSVVTSILGEPDLFTGEGHRWHILQTQEQANLAGRLGQTAIGLFYEDYKRTMGEDDSHVWLVMLNEHHEALTSIVAKRRGHERAAPLAGLARGVADCHVTGFMNADVFREFEGDIRQVCAALDLECYPNHMGGPLSDVEPESESMEP